MNAAKCGNEVIIFLDRHNDQPCAGEVEHVKHKVDFYNAGPACTLYFEANNNLFGADTLSLVEGDNWIQPKQKQGITGYAVGQRPKSGKGDPKLVVP